MELRPHILLIGVKTNLELDYRDIGTKSVNRYTDRETVSRIETFGKCQPYCQALLQYRVRRPLMGVAQGFLAGVFKRMRFGRA